MELDLFSSEIERREALLWNLVRIPSPTGDERELADYLQRYMLAQGWDVNREGNNLWLMPAGFDARKHTVLLLSALDTMPYSGSWLHDPYEGEQQNGRMYGVGVCRKMNLVLQLERFMQLTQSQLEQNVLFAACAETRNLGQHGLPQLLPSLPRIDEVCFAVPTDGMYYQGEQGLWEGRIRTADIESMIDWLKAHRGQVEVQKLLGEKGRGAEALLRGAEAVGGAETLRELLGHGYSWDKGETVQQELLPVSVLGFFQQTVKVSRYGVGRELESDEYVQLAADNG